MQKKKKKKEEEEERRETKYMKRGIYINGFLFYYYLCSAQ